MKFTDSNVLNFTSGRWGVALFHTTILAIICFILQNIIEAGVDLLASFLEIPSRISAIKSAQAEVSLISPIIIAPICENLICLFWLSAIFSDKKWIKWKGPLITAVVATLFHVVLYFEIRYISIIFNFFVICLIISNANNRKHGYWLSVLLHSEINSIVMIHLIYFNKN